MPTGDGLFAVASLFKLASAMASASDERMLAIGLQYSLLPELATVCFSCVSSDRKRFYQNHLLLLYCACSALTSQKLFHLNRHLAESGKTRSMH